MQAKTPLREKRRLSSRKAFLDAARQLFNDPGFEETTMGQIAELAELHLQTLYSHFPTKQALAATLHIEPFRESLANRKTSTIEWWRIWVGEAARKEMKKDGGATFLQFVMRESADPRLAGAQSEIAYRLTYSLARAIAEDFKMDMEIDRRPVLIAYMLWGGNADAVYRWSKAGGKGDLRQITVDALLEVETIVNNYEQFVGFTPR